MKRSEVVFFPSPGRGHLVAAAEMAKLLVDRDHRLHITLLVINLPFDFTTKDFQQSHSQNPHARIRFHHLAYDESNTTLDLHHLIDEQKPRVRDLASQIAQSADSRLAGFIVDMFCTSIMDVAQEFGVPSYVFFTSNAAFLGLAFHLLFLGDDQKKELTQLKDSDADLPVPSFANPVPATVLPWMVTSKAAGDEFLAIVRRFRQARGIIVNTFAELEPHAVRFLLEANDPPVYPVGPLLNLQRNEGRQSDVIMRWLDDQPPSSVVFLCFGSMGNFSRAQVKEMADGLERSGHRFLWSLRRPPPKGKMGIPVDYEDPKEILPEGFLERTAGAGRVIGWAPQVAVLSHPAVGGFVSHCGWNSALESLWCGVPMGAWPLYAEQQLNAFLVVKELGLGVEIKMDYRKNPMAEDEEVVLTAAEIERGIRRLMAEDSDRIRKRAEDMREKGRAAVAEGGSSHGCVGHLVDDVMKL